MKAPGNMAEPGMGFENIMGGMNGRGEFIFVFMFVFILAFMFEESISAADAF